MIRLWSGRVGLGLLLSLLTVAPSVAGPIMLSANDGIEIFEDGAYHMIPGNNGGSLSALDVSVLPPQILWTLSAEQTAVGPPSAIAVTPDGSLAIVSNPATLDPTDPAKRLNGKILQVFDLSGKAPRLSDSVELGCHPWGISIDPAGRHALVADGDGTVTLLRIEGSRVTVAAVVTLGPSTLLTMSTAFTRDGRWALVTRRGDSSVTVLRIDGDDIQPVRDITVGSNPYDVVVSPDGQYAAVSDIGRNSGDRNSVTLIDLRTAPFHAVDVFSVGPTPEGIAFSPDSRMLAVNSINGSNLKHTDPFYAPNSLVQLFDLSAEPVTLLGTAKVGANAQGLAFASDGKYLIVQDFASDSLLLFGVSKSGLSRTDMRVSMQDAPCALAVFDSR